METLAARKKNKKKKVWGGETGGSGGKGVAEITSYIVISYSIKSFPRSIDKGLAMKCSQLRPWVMSSDRLPSVGIRGSRDVRFTSPFSVACTELLVASLPGQ